MDETGPKYQGRKLIDIPSVITMPSTLGFGRITAAEDEVRTTLLMDFCSAAASSIARVAAITLSMTLSVSVLRDRSVAWRR